MQLVIPLAGLGTRLRPHTHLTAKPLIRVAGKEVIGHILDAVRSLGVDEVIFIVSHFQSKIEDYLKREYAHLKPTFVVQNELKGTAHALKLVEPYIHEDVLIIFSDTIFNANLDVIRNLPADLAGIIWTKEVEDYQRFGVIVADENGFIKNIIEKPQEPISKLANIGLYYFRDWKLFFAGVNVVLNRPLLDVQEYHMIDAIQYMADKGAKLQTMEVEEWLDCGKIETVLDTNRRLLEKGFATDIASRAGVIIHEPVMIAPEVVLEDVEIGPNVTIESGAVIKSSKISDSIVGQRAHIESSHLSESLIGADAQIHAIRGSINVADHSKVIGK